MKVGELIALLTKLPKNSPVVVAGDEIYGVEVVRGRMKQGYFGRFFTKNSKGKVDAVMFTKLTEFSTGEVIESTI
jgi:hypothetical protein